MCWRDREESKAEPFVCFDDRLVVSPPSPLFAKNGGNDVSHSGLMSIMAFKTVDHELVWDQKLNAEVVMQSDQNLVQN